MKESGELTNDPLLSFTGTDSMEALEPLRARYNAQHFNLRKFYYECSNLKYLTGLINVPKLGQVSLNLLGLASSLSFELNS